MAGWGSPRCASSGRWLCAALSVLVGCNQVFGLEPTVPEPPDMDRDGIADPDDNCPTFANADQTDIDADSFGDACDFCPALATSLNHDEDGDLRGDECDICPTSPDFQYDADADGVGDPCDLSNTPSQLTLFEPFATLGDSWQPSRTAWTQTGDAVAPTTPVQPDELGLHGSQAEISASSWWLRIGFLSRRPWESGDQFGIHLIDAAGNIYASCLVTCGATCDVKLVDPTTTTTQGMLLPTPIIEMRLEFYPGLHRCQFGQGPGVSLTSNTPANWPPLTPALVSVPHVQVMYVGAWR